MSLRDDIPAGTESTVQCVLMLSLAKQGEKSKLLLHSKLFFFFLGHLLPEKFDTE